MNGRLVKIITAGMFVLALMLSGVLVMAADEVAAKTPTYIGSDKCKMCHKGEKKGNVWEIWLESAHAKAMASLNAEKGEDKDPKCLKCHSTGFGTGGFGAEAMAELAGAEQLGGVGCESCHGPGSEYKSMTVMKDRDAAVKAGLVIPTEATCKTCHNEESPTFKGFNFAEAWAKIVHTVPAAAE